MTDHMPDDLSAVGRDLRAYTDELPPKTFCGLGMLQVNGCSSRHA